MEHILFEVGITMAWWVLIWRSVAYHFGPFWPSQWLLTHIWGFRIWNTSPILQNIPQVCLWGHSSRDCDISCLAPISSCCTSYRNGIEIMAPTCLLHKMFTRWAKIVHQASAICNLKVYCVPYLHKLSKSSGVFFLYVQGSLSLGCLLVR